MRGVLLVFVQPFLPATAFLPTITHGLPTAIPAPHETFIPSSTYVGVRYRPAFLQCRGPSQKVAEVPLAVLSGRGPFEERNAQHGPPARAQQLVAEERIPQRQPLAAHGVPRVVARAVHLQCVQRVAQKKEETLSECRVCILESRANDSRAQTRGGSAYTPRYKSSLPPRGKCPEKINRLQSTSP